MDILAGEFGFEYGGGGPQTYTPPTGRLSSMLYEPVEAEV